MSATAETAAADAAPPLPKAAPRARKLSAEQLQVVYRPHASLKPHPRNARKHSAEQIDQLARAIKVKWTNPILIDDDGTIIAGHGRWMAAAKLGMAKVPTITLGGLSDAQKRTLMLADNKLALNASWDPDLLHLELGELRGEQIDLTLTGFGTDELRDIVFPPTPKGRNGKRGLKDGLSYQVVIECDGEDHQAEVIEELRARGLKCKPMIL